LALPGSIEADDTQFNKAIGSVQRDPARAFRFAEQFTLDFGRIMLKWPIDKLVDRVSRVDRLIATAVDATGRKGLRNRLLWLRSAGLLAAILRSPSPLGMLKEINEQDRDGTLTQLLPCMSPMRTVVEFAVEFGEWPDTGPFPPGFPPLVRQLPPDVENWWDTRFLGAVCERIGWALIYLKAEPLRGYLADEELRTAVGAPDELMKDRRGRPFAPWKTFIARMQEAEDSVASEELREEIASQFGVPYRTLVGAER
jgi:hypothetical protein